MNPQINLTHRLAALHPIALGNFGSPLVETDRGTGFWDRARNEIHAAFGIVCGPFAYVRPATTEEAREFFSRRSATRAELTAYYDRKDAAGQNTGD